MDPRTRWFGFWLAMGLTLIGSVWSQELPHNDLDKGQSQEAKLVCYYSNWAVYRPGLAKFTPENINPYLCTHIIYAFAALSEDFHIQPFDPYNDMEQGNYRSFVSLKAYNPNLKTMIAVGGWNEGSKRFSRLVESENNRRTFISSVMTFLREYGFDGIDLDWEYPAFREGGNHTTDKRGYALLVKELRQAIDDERFQPEKERLILSVAVPATRDYIDQGFDVPEISRHAHFLNLLTYDYHSAYEPDTHHHAPLFPPAGLNPLDQRNQLNVAWTVEYYLSLGAPSHKLVVGIPMYGRSYTLASPQLATGYDSPAKSPGEEGAATREKGYLAFYEICQKVKEDDWEVEAPTPQMLGPYAYKNDQWVGFDDEEMVFNKAHFIMEKGLGGAMVWTLDNDDFRGLCTGVQSPLVNTLRDVLLNTNLIEGSSSQRSIARSAGPQPRSSVVRFDDDAAGEESTEVPRRRNTLRRLVQNRQSERNRQTASRRLITDSDESNVVAPLTTPAPPPTPDPGVAFECEDEGFFNNPRDCKKYFWCLDSGPANLGVVAHAFTCPSGLHFNSGSESCDYPENVVCPVGSIGATPPKPKPTPRAPRQRVTTSTTTSTTTTTTTTEAPTTTTEEPEEEEDEATQPTPNGSENIAELLRLLQAIGGVERLQSILGAQDQASSIRNHNTAIPTLPQYVTPKRAPADGFVRPTPTTPPPTVKPRRSQYQPDLFLDPYDVGVPDDVVSPVDEDVIDDFPFQYNTPPRVASVQPEVVYVKENNKDAAKEQPEVVPYEVPLRQTQPETTTTSTTPTPRGNYRTPIRVQVGRVVRVQNGAAPANTGGNFGDTNRRRMLVRVKPVNRTTDAEIQPTANEPTNEVTGRAVGRDERRLSGSTILATRANPLPANGNGETRVAVRRRPVYNGDRIPEEQHLGQGVRLVARRPNAIPESDRGNYVAVRRRPTTSETTTPTPTTLAPTTTPTTPAEPEPQSSNSSDHTEEYDEYEYYEEYEDETTTPPPTTTTTTTTTTTKRPAVRPGGGRRRFPAGASQSTKPTTTKAPTTLSSSSRSSNRRGSGPTSAAPASTTSRPAPPPSEDGPPVVVRSDTDIDCFKRGVFIHPTECSKFIVCAPASRNAGQSLKGRVLNCPANQIYLVEVGRCMKGDRTKCQKL